MQMYTDDAFTEQKAKKADSLRNLSKDAKFWV